MSDTYFDLPSRLEDSFPEIDSDIVTDLRKNNEEYAEIQQQISELKKQFPCIMNVMEEKGEIHLTAEEHAAFVQCLRLQRKLDDMEDPELTDFWQLLSYRDAIIPEIQRAAFTEVIEYEFTKAQ